MGILLTLGVAAPDAAWVGSCERDSNSGPLAMERRFRVQGLGFRALGFRALGFRVQGLGFRVQGLGWFRV